MQKEYLVDGNVYNARTKNYHTICSYCRHRYMHTNNAIADKLIEFLNKRPKSYELQVLVAYLDAFNGRENELIEALEYADKHNWQWFYTKKDSIQKQTITVKDEKDIKVPEGYDVNYFDSSITY